MPCRKNIVVTQEFMQLRLAYRFGDDNPFSTPREHGFSRPNYANNPLLEAGTLLTFLFVLFAPFLAIFWGLKDAIRLLGLTSDSGATTFYSGLRWDIDRIAAFFLSVLLATIWHEAGHFLAARSCRITVSEVGLVIYAIFPGAFVSVDPESFASAENVSKIKTILAGIWHNFLMCLAIWFFLYIPAAQKLSNAVVESLGAVDLSEVGVVIYRIDNQSPLSSLMAVGAVITHIDDIELHDNDKFEHWGKYFLRYPSDAASRRYANMGWCLPATDFSLLSTSCCDDRLEPPARAAVNREVCYQRSDIYEQIAFAKYGCLDPSAFVARTRCVDRCSDAGHEVCVRARAEERLIRLRITSAKGEAEDTTIFFQGDKTQLYNDVVVGKWHMSSWWSYRLLLFTRAFAKILWNVSASLVLVNALPLPHLDGAESLKILLITPHVDHSENELPRPASGSLYLQRRGRIDAITMRSLQLIRNNRMMKMLREYRWALPVLQITLAGALAVSSVASWTIG